MKLNKQVLYYDSIIFLSTSYSYIPKLGDYLGNFTSELDKDDCIIEFVSGGPKNYGYRTVKENKVIKVKGFTLNNSANESINFDKMVELVQESSNTELNVKQLRFVRDKLNWSVSTEEMIKKYKTVYDKRILFDDFSTIPYGYLY